MPQPWPSTAKNKLINIYILREIWKHTHTYTENTCEDESRGWGNAPTSQGAPKVPREPPETRWEAWTNFLSALRRKHPRNNSWTSSFQNRETHTSVVHPVCGTSSRKLEQTITEVDDNHTDLSPLTWLTNRFRGGCPLIRFHAGNRSVCPLWEVVHLHTSSPGFLVNKPPILCGVLQPKC